MRGKLIGALDKVSGNLQNMDQITKTTDVMSSVTSNPEEVKSTDKVCALIIFYSHSLPHAINIVKPPPANAPALGDGDVRLFVCPFVCLSPMKFVK